jgi:Clustered mitochondria
MSSGKEDVAFSVSKRQLLLAGVSCLLTLSALGMWLGLRAKEQSKEEEEEDDEEEEAQPSSTQSLSVTPKTKKRNVTPLLESSESPDTDPDAIQSPAAASSSSSGKDAMDILDADELSSSQKDGGRPRRPPMLKRKSSLELAQRFRLPDTSELPFTDPLSTRAAMLLDEFVSGYHNHLMSMLSRFVDRLEEVALPREKEQAKKKMKKAKLRKQGSLNKSGSRRRRRVSASSSAAADMRREFEVAAAAASSSFDELNAIRYSGSGGDTMLRDSTVSIDKPLCANCDERDAVVFCTPCKVRLCQLCYVRVHDVSADSKRLLARLRSTVSADDYAELERAVAPAKIIEQHKETLDLAALGADYTERADMTAHIDWAREMERLLHEAESWQVAVTDIPDVTSRASGSRQSGTDRVRKRLLKLAKDFSFCARTYGQIIIAEMNLPLERRTFSPLSVGGVGGGVKYRVRNILFKFVCKQK